MFEKVNPAHPDKVADRIAGAIVDLAYQEEIDPKIAVEVLIGHGQCVIMIESSVRINSVKISQAVDRIAGSGYSVSIYQVKQDHHLAENQKGVIRCGDNGIFKGAPVTEEQTQLSYLAHQIYDEYKSDGKYLVKDHKTTICQSGAQTEDLKKIYPEAVINPLGEWSGGPDVDTGATNRKLGSDMGDSITGGGLHGKDLSKADVSVNIYAWKKAQETGEVQEISCSIGDDQVDGKSYRAIVEEARDFILEIGGFEAFAEWGLI